MLFRSDLPANLLQFSFEVTTGGAQLGATSGVFHWVPAPNQLGTNIFTMRVTDNGEPDLSNTKSFSILVVAPPSIQSVTTTSGAVTLTWSAIPDRTYRVQFKDDLNESDWDDLAGDITAGAATASKADSSAFVGQRFYRILVLP